MSGSNPIEQDVHLTIEYDPDILLKYNESNYLDETNKYARELRTSDYALPMQSVEIKVGVDPVMKLVNCPSVLKKKR